MLWVLLLPLLCFGCIQSPPELPPIPANTSTLGELNDLAGIPNLSTETDPFPEKILPNTSDFLVNDPPEVLQNLNPSNISRPDQSRNVTGLIFGSGQYLLTLDDVVLDSSKPGDSCAAISIYDVNSSQRLDQEKVCVDYDQVWVPPSGHTYRIRLIKAVAGYTHEANWAEFRIFG